MSVGVRKRRGLHKTHTHEHTGWGKLMRGVRAEGVGVRADGKHI